MAGKGPYVAIFIVQALFSGGHILSKAAFDGGMDTYIFVFYRQAMAAIVFVPFAIASIRRTSPPPLTSKMLFKIIVLSLFGLTMNLNFFSIAIKYTSATVASAANNSIPVFTFLLAVLVRMEKLNLKSSSGIAKSFGLLLCICGITTITFYRGPQLISLDHYHPVFHRIKNNTDQNVNLDEKWIEGSFLMFCAVILGSLQIVGQGIILKEYPSSLMLVTLTSIFSAIQSFVVAIIAQRNMSRWKLHFDQGLLAMAYTGIVVAAIALYLQAWCIQRKGPVFVAMFQPLTLIMTTSCSTFLLGEPIILGSILGGTLMVGGLYSVLWGKRRELKEKNLNVEQG